MHVCTLSRPLTLLVVYAFVFYRRLWRVVGSNRRYVKPPVFNLVSSLRIIAFTSMQMFYFVYVLKGYVLDSQLILMRYYRLLVIGLYMNKVAMYVVPTAYMSLSTSHPAPSDPSADSRCSRLLSALSDLLHLRFVLRAYTSATSSDKTVKSAH